MPALITPAPIPTRRAPKVTGPTNTKAEKPTKLLPQDLINEARETKKVDFDAKKHLNFVPPAKTFTMQDFGYESQGISEIAASEPFQLYTEEAVEQIRAELFSKAVLKDHQYQSTFAKNMIRGYPQEIAPFCHALWKCPELLAAVSSVAGIELVPAFETEIGHVNITINEDTGAKDDGVGFSWHYDSFPFVCVTMLSDCTGMTGGETAVEMGNGEIMKVRGPNKGTAVILQGRYVEHAALKALGGKERISFITAMRPKNPHVRDELVLTGSRTISNIHQILNDYSEYRAVILEERFREKAKQLRERRRLDQEFDVEAERAFIIEQKEFLEAMLDEYYLPG